MKSVPSFFSIQPYLSRAGELRHTGKWMLYFSCGYYMHDCESFRAAWKAGQTHIRRDHKDDGVHHVYARQRPPVTTYLERDGREFSRFP